MRTIIDISVDDITPTSDVILKAQGIPDTFSPDKKIMDFVERSVSIYEGLAAPTGILMETSEEEFKIIYNGEGNNEKETPLDSMYKNADNLALFTVTIGNKISDEINKLFEIGEFPLGAILDSTASEGVELSACIIDSFYCSFLKGKGGVNHDSGMFRFSPGYCGWHISAQKKLFEFLRPSEMGVRLNENFLMDPLKSISGVIIIGPKEIFNFRDDYPFCVECQTHSCRDRIKAISESNKYLSNQGVKHGNS